MKAPTKVLEWPLTGADLLSQRIQLLNRRRPCGPELMDDNRGGEHGKLQRFLLTSRPLRPGRPSSSAVTASPGPERYRSPHGRAGQGRGARRRSVGAHDSFLRQRDKYRGVRAAGRGEPARLFISARPHSPSVR